MPRIVALLLFVVFSLCIPTCTQSMLWQCSENCHGGLPGRTTGVDTGRTGDRRLDSGWVLLPLPVVFSYVAVQLVSLRHGSAFRLLFGTARISVLRPALKFSRRRPHRECGVGAGDVRCVCSWGCVARRGSRFAAGDLLPVEYLGVSAAHAGKLAACSAVPTAAPGLIASYRRDHQRRRQLTSRRGQVRIGTQTRSPLRVRANARIFGSPKL